MPMRWTDQNKLLLFQKVFEQAPNFKVDFQSICDDWPGPDAPTLRGVKDQWSYCKKGTSRNANSTASSPRTPGKSVSQKQTPTSSLKMLSLAPGSKRCNNNSETLGSSTKKRKVKHHVDTLEMSADAQSSEDEGELGDEETDEDVAHTDSSPSPAVRRQPRRFRARTKRIVESEYESTSGNDVGKKKNNSDDEGDSDFDLVKDYESKMSRAERVRVIRERKRSTQFRKKIIKEKGNSAAGISTMSTDWKGETSSMLADLSDNVMEEEENDDDDDDDDDDDEEVKSQSTKRTSWQTAQSQFDELDEI